MSIAAVASWLRRSKFLRFGLPMISFVVLGSFGLAEFTAVRVGKRDEKNHLLTAEETLSFRKRPEKVVVEEEYERLLEELDIQHWENKRGPRPWESK